MKRNYRITILLILGLSHGFLDVFSFQPIPIPICNNISRIKPCHKFHATPQSKSSNDRLRFLTPDQEEFLNSLDEHTYGNQFIERLRDLQAYKNEHGTCHVPKRYAQNPTLGNWVNKSRQMYRKHREGGKSSMSPERIQVLDKIGFIWSGTEQTSFTIVENGREKKIHSSSLHVKTNVWNENFQELKEYIEMNVSSTSLSSGTKLGVWAARQRREYQNLRIGEKPFISQERVDLLNSVGFDWNPWNTKWTMRVRELLEYKKKYGDCLVPVQYAHNPKLGRWVSTQRKYYKLFKEGKPSYISKERIKELTDVGFIWDRWDDLWNGESENPWDSHTQNSSTQWTNKH